MPHRPIVVLTQQLEEVEATFDPEQIETIIRLSMAWAMCTAEEIEFVAARRAEGNSYKAIRQLQEMH